MFGISYWILPVWSGCVWLGTLLAMIAVWARQGKPQYGDFRANQHIPYISDIGATSWGKPLFIAGSAASIVVFTITFLAERWLRHSGRLARDYHIAEKVLSILASLFAIIGALGLILLTIFDTVRYTPVHNAMTAVFIVGYILSAIAICAEYQRLGSHFRQYKILAWSFWIKLAFIIIEIVLAIAYGVLAAKHRYDDSPIFEWVIAVIFIFYMFSFVIDFLPATHTKHKADRFGPAPVRAEDDENAMKTQEGGNMLGGPVYTNGGHYGGAQNGTATVDGRHYNQPSRNF